MSLSRADCRLLKMVQNAVSPAGIDHVDRSIGRIKIELRPVHDPLRITTDPSPEPWRVEAGPMVVKTSLIIVSFFACVAVTFGIDFHILANGLVRRTPIGVVFLVG